MQVDGVCSSRDSIFMLENDEKPRVPTTQWTNGILITIYDKTVFGEQMGIDMFSIGNEMIRIIKS